MNRKQLIDNLLKNWPAKIICFAIAIFLYLFYQASLIDKKSFVVPLEIQESGLVVHVGNVPSSVVINIKANENEIKAIFASDFKATLNLNNIVSSGTYDIPIEVSISEKLMSIDPLEVKLKEEKLSIDVEKLITRFIKVEPSVVGEVDSNYEIKEIKMEPSTIEVRGPESIVNAIDTIKTDKVNVSNAKTNFSVEADYLPLSRFVKISEKKPNKATVVVVPRVIEQEYVNVPVKILNLNEELELAKPVTGFNITYKGDMASLSQYKVEKNPIRIDLTDITEPGTYNVPVTVIVPYNFELVQKTGDTIQITLKKKEKAKLLIPFDELENDNKEETVVEEKVGEV